METSTIFLTFMTSLTFVYHFYKWATKNDSYFKDVDIKYVKPTFLFGHNFECFTQKTSKLEHMKYLYDQFPDEQIMGTFDMCHPTFIIRDPKLIKQIGIEDFEYFSQHRTIFATDTDPLYSNSLPMLVGSQWYDMRTTLSPVFTGSKMRFIFELMSKCGEKIVKHLRDEHHKNGRQELEIKDFVSRFANDMIATSAFGIEVDSYREKTNIFYTNAAKIRNFKSPLMMLKVFGFLFAPWFMKKLNFSLLDKDASSYFAKMLSNNFEDREKYGIIRNDMIHLLLQLKDGSLPQDKRSKKFDEGFAVVEEVLQAKKTSKTQWSNDELIAQCFIFFFAGFETISDFLPLLIYELTINLDVQEKLFAEIRTAKIQNEQLTYEALHKMKYLDMVVSEGLRKWTPSPAIDRLCMKDYLLKVDGREVLIEKDTSVWFPIYALHNDPKYFPDPEKFMPERFDDENKKNIVTGSYLPFGIGPRNCIGSRFALMETKILIYYIIQNFTMKPTEKTGIPIKMSRTVGGFLPDKGVWVEFRPRI